MSQPARRQLFVTTALPYANGKFHIGHIMEYIQADIWVRFQRMQGHQVHFVGADDAHGAPIMIAAEKAGLSVNDELIALNGYRINQSDFESFVSGLSIGDQVTVLISRDQVISSIKVTMEGYQKPQFQFSFGTDGKKLDLRNYWLR